MDKKVLVTGGAGFIGSHIVEALLDDGYDVRIYDNFTTGTEKNLAACIKRVEIIKGDILEKDKLCKAMKGCDSVSHQAAQLEITTSLKDPAADLEVNTVGTLNVFDCARRNGIKEIVQASSACVYGRPRYIPSDEDKHPTRPNWSYGVSKLACERYAEIYSNYYSIPIVSLRYGIIYGPREWYGRVLTIFLKRALENKDLIVFGQGEQLRDFTYVKDVSRFHSLLLKSPKKGHEIYNVSTSKGTSIARLAEIIQKSINKKIKVEFEDIEEGETSKKVSGRMRLPLELDKMVLDNSKAKALGWAPQVELAEGLRNEYEWLEKNIDRWKKMSY